MLINKSYINKLIPLCLKQHSNKYFVGTVFFYEFVGNIFTQKYITFKISQYDDSVVKYNSILLVV